VRRRLALITAVALCAGLLGMAPHATASPHKTSKPAATGLLDCNGYSPLQKTLAHFPCAEISSPDARGFEDNGHYVGHDEPALQFLSTTPGSGNSAKYRMTLPVEPQGAPNGTMTGPIWTFQQRIADWFGMVLCDNQSYPEGSSTCTPNSDSNIQVPVTATHAGAAYMELQFYPPGDPPFISNISCDTTHWCAAIAIFSLQATFGFGSENDNCIEPANFAWIQMDGIPTGPPGPDLANNDTFTPNDSTLLMNQGDRVVVQMNDTAAGFYVKVKDATTGNVGYMTASTANGFRHILWDPTNFTCAGAPYAFHPMYSTASPPTQDGHPTTWATWSAHTYNVAYTSEIGHAEVPTGDEDDTYCPSNVLGFDFCQATDFDFDGFSYRPVWTTTSKHPTEWYVNSPISRDPVTHKWDSTYPNIAFEADLPRIEASDFNGICDRNTGDGCVNPPAGAAFYPWFHLTSYKGCSWALTDNNPDTTNRFGGEVAAFGKILWTDYGAYGRYNNFNSGVLPNSCI
jgi:hypothetical protein